MSRLAGTSRAEWPGTSTLGPIFPSQTIGARGAMKHATTFSDIKNAASGLTAESFKSDQFQIATRSKTDADNPPVPDARCPTRTLQADAIESPTRVEPTSRRVPQTQHQPFFAIPLRLKAKQGSHLAVRVRLGVCANNADAYPTGPGRCGKYMWIPPHRRSRCFKNV